MKILRYGAKGKEVKALQNLLIKEFDADIEADGEFGSITKWALIQVQKSKKIPADGIYGPQSYYKLNNKQPTKSKTYKADTGDKKTVRRLLYLEIKRRYGNPLSGLQLTNNFKKQMTIIDFPTWFPSKKVYCHEDMAKALKMWFKKIEDAKLQDLILTYDGCYNPRKIRGGTSPSMHAMGLAIDINAKWNGLGRTPATGFGTVRPLVELARESGLYWGGDFIRGDGMHFELGIKVIKPVKKEKKEDSKKEA